MNSSMRGFATIPAMPSKNTNYFRVAISTSLVAFGFNNEQLSLLLKKKQGEPFKGAPCLPTNWVSANQEVEDVAQKVMQEALGQNPFQLEQLNAFAKLYRKPEGRVVNIAQMCLVESEITATTPPNDGFYWNPITNIPTLIYDHNEIVNFARERLKRRIKRRPVGFNLLNKEFTIRNIHSLYEQGLNKPLDRRNFYKKLVKSDLLIDLNKTKTEVGSKKPSNLYAFNQQEYERLTLKGYDLKF